MQGPGPREGPVPLPDRPRHRRTPVDAHVYALERRHRGESRQVAGTGHDRPVHPQLDVHGQVPHSLDHQQDRRRACDHRTPVDLGHGAVAVPRQEQPVVDHVEGVAAALVAVGHQRAAVAGSQVQRDLDLERTGVDELQGPVALGGRAVGQEAGLCLHLGVPRWPEQVLDVVALVQREHLVGPGRPLPGVDQLGDLLRVLVGQVPTLRRILFQVVQLPDLVAERRAWLPADDGRPAVAVHTPVPHLLVVLLGMGAGRRPVVDRRREAGPCRGRNGSPVHGGRHVDADEVQQGGQQVGDVLVLATDAASAWQARTLREDERHLVAALVGVDLVEAEGRARHHRPARRIVGQGPGSAHQVQARVVELDGVQRVGAGLADQRAEVGRRAVVQPLPAPAVVRGEHNDRVLPLAHGLQPVSEATQVLVDVVDHAGEDLLVPGE